MTMFIMEPLSPNNMPVLIPGELAGELTGELTGDLAGRSAWSRSNLTLSQWQIWHEQRSGGLPRARYTLSPLSVAFTFQASLDTRLFRQAFQSVVERSDALRTVIVEVEGVPQRHVLPSLPMSMDIVDLSAAYQPGAAYEQWMAERDLRPLPPALRMFDSTLLRLGEQHYVWRLVLHRLIADSRSLALVYRHTADAYAATVTGADDAMEALPPFEDYVRQDRRQVRSPAVPEVRSSSRPQGRFARPLPVAGERYVLDMGPERTKLLRYTAAELAAAAGDRGDAGSALFLLSAAALAALLARRRRCRTVCIDTDVDLRRPGPWQDTLGRVSRTCTLTVDEPQQQSFADIMGRLGKELAKAQQGSQPGQCVAGPNAADQNANRPTPACYALLQVDDLEFPPFAGAEVKVERLDRCYSARKPAEQPEAKIEPSVCLRIEGYTGRDNLRAVFTICSGHLGDTRGPQLAQEYMRLLDALLSAREQPIGSLYSGL